MKYDAIPVVPISAMHGNNVCHKTKKMRWYKGATLIDKLDEIIDPNKPPLNKPLRGVVQDVYPYLQGSIAQQRARGHLHLPVSRLEVDGDCSDGIPPVCSFQFLLFVSQSLHSRQ